MRFTRIAIAALAIVVGISAPAFAQSATPDPSPQATPDAPSTDAKPGAKACGQKIESFIQSLRGQVDGLAPSTDAQRHAADAFRTASDKALAMLHDACKDEKSAAAIKDLESAQDQMNTAIQSLVPALQNLYASLNDEQKAQLKELGQQLQDLAQGWGSELGDLARNFDRYLRDHTDTKSGETRMCFGGFCFSYRNDFSNGGRTPDHQWHGPLRDGEEEL